jgi:hypothetical protein
LDVAEGKRAAVDNFFTIPRLLSEHGSDTDKIQLTRINAEKPDLSTSAEGRG